MYERDEQETPFTKMRLYCRGDGIRWRERRRRIKFVGSNILHEMGEWGIRTIGSFHFSFRGRDIVRTFLTLSYIVDYFIGRLDGVRGGPVEARGVHSAKD